MKNQFYDAFHNLIPNLYKLLQSVSDDQKLELYAIKRATEMNSIQKKDPMNYFEVLNSKAKALDIETEQKKRSCITRSDYMH